MYNERGLQSKADDTSRRQWEGGDFPLLCESCLGESPYIRMQKAPYASGCKMCDRPFTVFKWRPGRGEGYKKTEVCQTCSKIKNVCQTCILDLQFGLPSQLRDAVLSHTDGTLVVPESDINREYFAQQHVALLASGHDPWQTGETPNERLLKIARAAAEDRSQDRVKLLVKENPSDASRDSSNSGNISFVPKTFERERDRDDDLSSLPLPPTDVTAPPNSVAPLPPKPKGPPPAWAFKNKNQADENKK